MNPKAQAAIGGLQIATQIASFFAARREARRLRALIASNTRTAYEDLDLQAIEMQQAATDKVSLRARQGVLERGRLSAVFADSGATGNTQMRIRRESLFNEGDDVSSVQSNLGKGLRQVERQKQATFQNAQQQMLGARGPSVLGLIGGILGTTASNKELSAGVERAADRVTNWTSSLSSRFRLDGQMAGDRRGSSSNRDIYG